MNSVIRSLRPAVRSVRSPTARAMTLGSVRTYSDHKDHDDHGHHEEYAPADSVINPSVVGFVGLFLGYALYIRQDLVWREKYGNNYLYEFGEKIFGPRDDLARDEQYRRETMSKQKLDALLNYPQPDKTFQKFSGYNIVDEGSPRGREPGNLVDTDNLGPRKPRHSYFAEEK